MRVTKTTPLITPRLESSPELYKLALEGEKTTGRKIYVLHIFPSQLGKNKKMEPTNFLSFFPFFLSCVASSPAAFTATLPYLPPVFYQFCCGLSVPSSQGGRKELPVHSAQCPSSVSLPVSATAGTLAPPCRHLCLPPWRGLLLCPGLPQ